MTDNERAVTVTRARSRVLWSPISLKKLHKQRRNDRCASLRAAAAAGATAVAVAVVVYIERNGE